MTSQQHSKEITPEDATRLKEMGLGHLITTKHFIRATVGEDTPTPRTSSSRNAARKRLAGVTKMRRRAAPRECRPIDLTGKTFTQKHQGRNGHINVQSVVYEAAEQRLRAAGHHLPRNELLRYIERIVHTRDRTIKVRQVAGALGHLIKDEHLKYVD